MVYLKVASSQARGMPHFILSDGDKQNAFLEMQALNSASSFLSINLNAGPDSQFNVAINLTHYATDKADNSQSRNAIRQLSFGNGIGRGLGCVSP